METVVTQSALTNSGSGAKFKLTNSVPLDGSIYAQPLVLPNVKINGTVYAHVAYVVTEHEWLYVINADATNGAGAILGSVQLLDSGYTWVSSQTDLFVCSNFFPNPPGDVGITGTPVIDLGPLDANGNIASGTLYLVAKSKTPVTATGGSATYQQKLYAVDITNISTSGIKASTPITGTFSGTTFAPRTQNQRGALLALPAVTGQQPQIVMTWGSHCDHFAAPTYQGWVMSYQLSQNGSGYSLNQTGLWMDIPATATQGGGGVWQGGAGPSADANRNFYFGIGNGDFNIPNGGAINSCTSPPCDYGNAIMKMSVGTTSTFNLLDYFTTFDQSYRSTSPNDYDVGSGGTMLLPKQSAASSPNLMAQVGKEGNVFLLSSDTGSMGGYHTAGDTIVQEIAPPSTMPDAGPLCYVQLKECGVWGAPAWWTTTNSGITGYTYWGGKNLPIREFAFYPVLGNGITTPGFQPASYTGPWTQTAHTFYGLGTTPAVSWGTGNTNAIVWAIDSSQAQAAGAPRLYAFDALSLTCLYATVTVSHDNCTRVDTASVPLGSALFFGVPTVANGQVFVGSAMNGNNSYLNVYGVK